MKTLGLPIKVTLDGGPHAGRSVWVSSACKIIVVESEPDSEGARVMAAYVRAKNRAAFRDAWIKTNDEVGDEIHRPTAPEDRGD